MARDKFDNIKINLNSIWKYFVSISSFVFSLLGFVAVFIDVSVFFWNWIYALLCIFIILIVIFLMAIVVSVCKKNKVVFNNKNQKTLTIGYGDIFTEVSKIKVIAVNRCFDLEVNSGNLISPNSLHGQFIQKQLKNISVKDLQSQIKESLKFQQCNGEIISQKSKGNQLRYPVGTIAEVRDGDTIYYLLALTEMDNNLNAHCSLEDYCLSISNLMKYFDQCGQGYDMLMPIIGAGFARLDRSEKELLELLISLVKIHQTNMRGSIKIVVHKSLKSKISIINL